MGRRPVAYADLFGVAGRFFKSGIRPGTGRTPVRRSPGTHGPRCRSRAGRGCSRGIKADIHILCLQGEGCEAGGSGVTSGIGRPSGLGMLGRAGSRGAAPGWGMVSPHLGLGGRAAAASAPTARLQARLGHRPRSPTGEPIHGCLVFVAGPDPSSTTRTSANGTGPSASASHNRGRNPGRRPDSR